MFTSGPVPCARCGAATSRGGSATHECDPARRVEFEMLGLRTRILSFEEDLADYLATNEGRFEVWLAARDVARGRACGPRNP